MAESGCLKLSSARQKSRRPCLDDKNMNVYVSGKKSMSPFCGCYVCHS